MYQHVAAARSGTKVSPCLNRIRKLEREGRQVTYERVFWTDDAEDAYRKEAELIARFGVRALTNLTYGGEGSRRVTTSPQHREKIRLRIKQLYAEGRLTHPGKAPPGSASAEVWERQKHLVSAKLKGRPRGPDSEETRLRKAQAQRELWVSGKRTVSPAGLERMREGGRRGGLIRSRTKA